MLLACVAATAASLIASLAFDELQSPAWRPDPGRIIQGVLAGIGFLGAGSILREGNSIRGVTTAASLWFVTVLGLAIGLGYFLLAGLSFAIGIVALAGIPFLERRIRSELHATLSVSFDLHAPLEPRIRDAITSTQTEILATTFERTSTLRTLHFALRYRRREGHDLGPELESRLATIPGLTQFALT